MISGRLGRRIRRIRGIRSRLGKRTSCTQGPVDLIRRDMQEAKSCARRGLKPGKVPPGRFEQHERTDDVGLDERSWVVNRTIDVTLRSAIHHRCWAIFTKDPFYSLTVNDIRLQEHNARVRDHLVEATEISGIG